MNIIIWIISICTLICSYRLFSKAAGTINIRFFNTVTYVFYYCIIITTFIGSILCALGFGQDHWILCYAHENARIGALLAVCYSMIAMPMGMILLNNLLGIKPKTEFFNYIDRKVSIDLSESRLRHILSVLVIISFITFIYIKQNSSSWPLFTAVIEKDLLSANEGRIDVRLNFHGIIYIKNLIGLTLVPLFTYFAFIISIFRRKLFYRLAFILLFTITILTLTYDIQKAPIIFYLLGFLIIRVLVKGAISWKAIALFIIIAISLMAILYTMFNASTNGALDIILDPRSAMWGRMFISGYAGVPLSFEWFPDVIHDPTWQIGIPEFVLRIFDLPTTESARLLMLKIHPEGNLISSYYIAEAWANYGIIGVLLAPIIVGINVQVIQIFLFKSQKNPLTIAFYALVTTKWVISSGFVNFLFFKFLFFSFLIYYLAKILIYKITIRI